jgi:hypothetical protein
MYDGPTDSSSYYRCGQAGHQASNCPGTDSRCNSCHRRGHSEAVWWTAHPDFKPGWTSAGKNNGGSERGLAARVDALAAQVEKLTLRMATFVFGNARQAALPEHPTGSDDEGAVTHDPKPAAYGAVDGHQPPTCDLARDWQVVDTSDPASVAASLKQYLQAAQTHNSSVSEPAAGAAYRAQSAQHPMDAAFENEEYQARCAAHDAYGAQREKEEEGRKWPEKLLNAWEERQLKRQNE